MSDARIASSSVFSCILSHPSYMVEIFLAALVISVEFVIGTVIGDFLEEKLKKKQGGV